MVYADAWPRQRVSERSQYAGGLAIQLLISLLTCGATAVLILRGTEEVTVHGLSQPLLSHFIVVIAEHTSRLSSAERDTVGLPRVKAQRTPTARLLLVLDSPDRLKLAYIPGIVWKSTSSTAAPKREMCAWFTTNAIPGST